MAKDEKSLEEVIKELSPDMQREVGNFVDSLIEKRSKKSNRRPQFGWAGALSDLRDKYSSVALQHKISEWRIGER